MSDAAYSKAWPGAEGRAAEAAVAAGVHADHGIDEKLLVVGSVGGGRGGARAAEGPPRAARVLLKNCSYLNNSWNNCFSVFRVVFKFTLIPLVMGNRPRK